MSANLVFPARLLAATLLLSAHSFASDGKLRGTGGLQSIDGSAGGGITPWAVIGGYAEAEQWSVNAGISRSNFSDYALTTASIGASVGNRAEFSLAQQDFSLPNGAELGQNIASVKVRIAGDLIYGAAPQFSIGASHRRHSEKRTLESLGISRTSGTDFVFSAAKLWLDGPFGRNFLANVSARHSGAQEIGLLGFHEDAQWSGEAALAILPNRYWAIGLEFRQKPGYEDALPENHWRDVFIAYFPNKFWSGALAYVDLGTVAARADQRGVFFTLQANF
jgi:hypothetical protein